MRSIVAFAGLLAFANLSFVQATGWCPLSSTHPASVEASEAPAGEHAGHSMPVPGDDDSMVGEVPAGDSGHPNCFMIGPCGLSVDVSQEATSAAAVTHREVVRAHSDRAPASLTTAPDIPPPRA